MSKPLTWALLAGAWLLACQMSLDLEKYEIRPADTGFGGTAGGANGSAGRASAAGAGGSAPGSMGGRPECNGACDALDCAASGECGESSVELRGTVVSYHTGSPLSLVELAGGPLRATSGADGAFALGPVPPGTEMNLLLTLPDNGLRLAFRETVLALDVGAQNIRALDAPAVEYAWLTQLAMDCGLLDGVTSPDDIARYFNMRSTVLVEVLGPSVAGITRDRIELLVQQTGGAPYPQFAEPDTDSQPTSICFIQAEEAGGGWRGGTQQQTTQLGRFAVFRVRNRSGSGSSQVEVRIDGFPPARRVNITSAAQTAVVRVGGEW
jgi:hypothetical protein